jgi:hypothetical protein
LKAHDFLKYKNETFKTPKIPLISAKCPCICYFSKTPLHQAHQGYCGIGLQVKLVKLMLVNYVFFSSSKVRILDASGPPGHPALHMGDDTANTGGISALEFSEDGEVRRQFT